MSDTNPEAPETGAEDTEIVEQKPEETVEHWKTQARRWEKQSKANAEAATKLAKLEDAQKSDAQRAADATAKAEAEIAGIPAKVAESLRGHLVKIHSISADQAELYLTASDPELLLKQVAGLVDMGPRKSNRVPREGRNPKAAEDDMAEFTRQVFGSRE